MKKIKTLIAGLAVAGFMGAAYASPITVGGITWDPDYSTAAGQDYEAGFNFTQWYSSTSTASTSTAGGSIADGNFTNALAYGGIKTDLEDGGTFGNYWLQGVGEIYYMNGLNGTFAAPGKELTYAFGGIKLNSDSSFDTSEAWFKVYVNSTTPDYNHPTSSEAAVADAQSGSLWLGGDFDFLTLTPGSTIQNGLVSARLNVTEGAAQFHFDPVLEYSASAFFAGINSKYSQAGNGQIRGNTVPEPATLALMGMGLLGFAAARRRSSKNAADSK